MLMGMEKPINGNLLVSVSGLVFTTQNGHLCNGII